MGCSCEWITGKLPLCLSRKEWGQVWHRFLRDLPILLPSSRKQGLNRRQNRDWLFASVEIYRLDARYGKQLPWKENMSPSQQLTIEQAISRANKAAEQGNIDVARQLYSAVLQHQPTTRLQHRGCVNYNESCHTINPCRHRWWTHHRISLMPWSIYIIPARWRRLNRLVKH